MTDIIKQLIEIVGDQHLLLTDAVAERATHFWDPSPMQAKALVKPATTLEVSAVLKDYITAITETDVFRCFDTVCFFEFPQFHYLEEKSYGVKAEDVTSVAFM